MSWFWIVVIVVVALYFLSHAFRGSVKHSAVQNAFLAKYTFGQLSQAQKKQVHEQTLQIMKRGCLLEEDFPEMSEMLKFSFNALAMEELSGRGDVDSKATYCWQKVQEVLIWLYAETAETGCT